MAIRGVTTEDVYTASFNAGKVCRFSPDARGVYQRIWVVDGPGSPIGMTDDGKWLYLATWQQSTIVRYDLTTGVMDPNWSIIVSGLVGAGDLESLTIRTVGGRNRIVGGYADEPSNGDHIWEYDIQTKALVKSYKFRNAVRGADWIWSLPNNEFLVGTESDKYWRVNIDTGVETPYITGVGVSYSIEMRNGVIAAANAVGGSSLTIGKANPHDASGYQTLRTFTNLPISVYFSTSIDYSGKYAWIANYSTGRGLDGLGNPIYRINTATGAGADQPVAHIPEGWDVNGIYAPFRARLNNLAGAPVSTGAHLDPTADASGRLLSH